MVNLVRRSVFLLFFLFHGICSNAQPYIDVVNIRGWWMPGVRAGDQGIEHRYYNASFDLPLKIDSNNVIVFSPFVEHWRLDSSSIGNVPSVNGYVFPVTWVHQFRNSPWGFSATGIFRWNMEVGVREDNFQLGGAGIANYKVNDRLKLKLGCYLNKDFFGLFVLPLAGLEWRPNDNLTVFGNLPGRLTVEQRVTNRFYFGLAFRAYTNSYRLIGGSYLRIDQNQIGGFADFYLTNHLVFNFEAGYSVLPELRSGRGENDPDSDLKDIDGFYLKASVAWRIRFDG